jgi:hypothetical protein
MSIFEDSKTDLHVVRAANATALRAALTAGTMGGFYATGTNAVPVVAALTALNEYEYCSRDTRGALRKSPSFFPEQIANATYMLTTARTEQITHLGYNGVAGSMDAANSTYYGLKVILDHTFGMLNNSPMIVTIPYKSDATATQREVAAGLANAATSWLKRQAYRPFRVERINSGALLDAVAAGGAATAAVTNGSKIITLSSDQSTTVFVGSILRLGVSGAGTGACYVVTAIAAGGQVVTLDQEYQGATAAVYAAATIETVTEGNWGLQFTGISPTDAEFNPVTDEPFVPSFTLEAGDFTTATVTYTTAPFLGRGTYQQVAYEEAHMQFQNKTREVSAYPPTTRDLMAVAAEGYNIFTFDVIKQNYLDPVTGQRPISKHRIRIAVLSTVAAELVEYLTVLGNPGILTGNPA